MAPLLTILRLLPILRLLLVVSGLAALAPATGLARIAPAGAEAHPQTEARLLPAANQRAIRADVPKGDPPDLALPADTAQAQPPLSHGSLRVAALDMHRASHPAPLPQARAPPRA